MIDAIIPIVTTALGSVTTLLTIWYRNKLEKEKKARECLIAKSVEEDSFLLEKLKEIRESVGACRAAIYQFHNGGEYFTGKSMKKYSMTYEQVEKGIARILNQNQSVPVSGGIKFFAKLLEERTAHYQNIERDFPETLLKYQLQDNGIESIYTWAILDLDKRVIGVFTLDFIKESTHISEEELDRIQLTVIKLAGYL